ncbi:cell division protein ZapA [Palleronia sediminis]|uniref:Cell division protein ZapA n=1 Tax=Palleronia sediminis TaxID=2547833 RepID=A0A4R6ALK7_9RHOB|nr:cell division protein ZapA [Palleronia sediminis]TDL84134.1 cell division protein ZapA [Palleronia sediminis]
MPEETIVIGGREFAVACQDGEEHFLRSAAAMLDAEAKVMLDQLGRMPPDRMLLMAGLLLADKAAGIDEQLRAATARTAELEAEVARLNAAPTPEPRRVEVPVIPRSLLDAMGEMAARAEALADETEQKLAPSE